MKSSNHTFVIPAYGDSVYLEACILSLKHQTIASKILITTSTPSHFLSEIADKHGIEIRINKDSGGLADDWDFAYKTCQTKYLTLAHQDDIYFPEYAERCIRAAEKPGNESCLILFPDYKELVDNNLRKSSVILFVKKLMLTEFIFRKSIGCIFLKKSLLVFGNPIACPAVMFNVEAIGPFEFNRKYLYNVDWEAWIRLAVRRGRFVYINKKLMAHRLHRESQTSIQIENNIRQKEEEAILKSLWGKWIGKGIFFFYRFGGKLY